MHRRSCSRHRKVRVCGDRQRIHTHRTRPPRAGRDCPACQARSCRVDSDHRSRCVCVIVRAMATSTIAVKRRNRAESRWRAKAVDIGNSSVLFRRRLRGSCRGEGILAGKRGLSPDQEETAAGHFVDSARAGPLSTAHNLSQHALRSTAARYRYSESGSLSLARPNSTLTGLAPVTRIGARTPSGDRCNNFSQTAISSPT